MRAKRFAIAVASALGAPFVVLAAAVCLTPLPPELRAGVASSSVRVTDRDGALLHEARAEDGARARWTSLADCGPLVARAIVDTEDRRFYRHLGVDPLALGRAFSTDVRARRAASGGSTLTMQLARALRPHARSLAGKLGEMVLALRIERSLSKAQILEQYLNRVALGPNLRGIAAASRGYFGKPPAALSPAQAALLVGLARGPSYYDLLRHSERAVARRDRVLHRMFEAGDLTPESLSNALAEPVVLQRSAPAFGAPHWVRAVMSGAFAAEQPGLAEAMSGRIEAVRTTLDPSLQRAAEAAAARIPADLSSRHVTASSVVAIDNATGDVLAYVGSPDFFDAAHGGQNDGVRARRQPGSTLKPFLYALAIEQLGWTAATVLPDVDVHVPTPGGDYTPHDYDERTRGPVRLREALGNSLNIPAVWTGEQVGAASFLERLRALGFSSLDQSADYYGPGLALGDGEVTLLELARAYATLARGGESRPLRFVRSVRDANDRVVELPVAPAERVFPESVAAQITDVLRDPGARSAAFGARSVLDFDFDVAAKTGTSKGYRDNWVVGFTRDVTVGVWVGNFDGSPMSGTSGITGAGPLFHAVMDAAARGRAGGSLAIGDDAAGEKAADALGLRRVEVCALSGERPGPACTHRILEWMSPAAADRLPECTFHERLAVDRRNELRAGPSCASADVVWRDFERFPPEFARWAEAVGRPIAPAESSPFCPASDAVEPAGANDGLRIVSPEDGARFAIDPDRPRSLQRLDVEIAAPAAAGPVRLRVDGSVVGDHGPPYAFDWPLVPGDHVLVAEATGAGLSPPLRIHVRGM